MNRWFFRRRAERLRLGVVANEFFDLSIGRMGGFGWAAAQVARCFGEDPALGVDVTFFTGEKELRRPGEAEAWVHGTRLLLPTESYAARVRAEAPDLLLLIDYRPSYRPIVDAVRAPIILWSRDPRPPEDVAKVATLRLPGAADVVPAGVSSVDCTSFASVFRRARWRRRPALVATTTPWLKPKVAGTYGVGPSRIWDLPNILPDPPSGIARSARPRVIFLGRLDPVKRPWIVLEIARRLPEIQFDILGRAYVDARGAWQPGNWPANVRMVDHLDGSGKQEALASAWALVNTSIHEGLAVSFLEALGAGTPIVSCQDPEGLATRFGAYVGRWDGDGLDSVPAFVRAVEGLIANPDRWQRLGAEGREWVRRAHSRRAFLEAFEALCRKARVTLTPWDLT